MASNSGRRSKPLGRLKRRDDSRAKAREERSLRSERVVERPVRTGDAAAHRKRLEREARLTVRRRRSRFRSLIWLALVALILMGLVGVYRSSLFTVEHVEVVGAMRRTADEIRVRAQVPPDATLLRFPADEVVQHVLEDPWIADVSVTRDFPDTMVITVSERKPSALVDLVEHYWLVDNDGYVLERQSFEETSVLPVIRDVQGMDPQIGRRSAVDTLLNALSVLDGLSDELRSRVRAVSASTIDETALITLDGVEVLFGVAEDMTTKDAIALAILDEQEGLVVFVDVRNAEMPVWRGLEPVE